MSTPTTTPMINEAGEVHINGNITLTIAELTALLAAANKRVDERMKGNDKLCVIFTPSSQHHNGWKLSMAVPWCNGNSPELSRIEADDVVFITTNAVFDRHEEDFNKYMELSKLGTGTVQIYKHNSITLPLLTQQAGVEWVEFK